MSSYRQVVPRAYLEAGMKATAEEIEHRALVEFCQVVSPWSLKDLGIDSSLRPRPEPSSAPAFLWWHTPSWRPSKVQAKLLSLLGTRPGVPDLIALNLRRRGPGLELAPAVPLGFLEFKGPTGSASRDQRRFRDLVVAAGHPWELCRLAAEAEIHLRRWRMIPQTEGRSLLPRDTFQAVLEELEAAA